MELIVKIFNVGRSAWTPFVVWLHTLPLLVDLILWIVALIVVFLIGHILSLVVVSNLLYALGLKGWPNVILGYIVLAALFVFLGCGVVEWIAQL